MRRALGYGLVALLGLSCSSAVEPELAAAGTVEFVEVESGCWIIRVDSIQYEPTNLADEFKVDGLAVRFEAHSNNALPTACQLGPVIELTHIERVTGLGS